MLPKLGKALLRPAKSYSLKSAIEASSHFVKKNAVPLAPAMAVRAFSVQTIRRAQAIETTKSHHSTQQTTKSTPQSYFNTLDDCRSTGNLKAAIKAVQNAQEKNIATPALYLHLIDLLRELPFDVNDCATVAHWFYSEKSNLPSDVLQDMNVWKSVLKLGFKFGPTFRSEDLRALVDKFTETFDLATLDDPVAWQLLIRAYGILNKREAVSAYIKKQASIQGDKPSFYSSALISYAAIDAHDDVEKTLETLKSKNKLSRHTLLKLIRCYGFSGDIEHTLKYTNMCDAMFPDKACDKTMLLIAHKVALHRMYDDLCKERGSRGLSLKPTDSTLLEELHASWNNLTKDMFSSETPVDITDCNVVLEYLTIANKIDPVEYPMEKAEEIFNSYMPGHYITPNDASHRIMLVGYATSQQYNKLNRNTRLDKTLEMVSKMQVAGIDTLNHPTFHALFRACLPHRKGCYYYDHFRLNSLLPARPIEHTVFPLDPRLFEIERIMLESKLPHDRFTFTTLVTCLAASGQNKALRSRWRMLKLHGLRRDVGMYRLAFALASLNPTQAKHAIYVTRNEMNREIDKTKMDWETYAAMLDCCITAQLPIEAKDIIEEMRKNARSVHNGAREGTDLIKWPYMDEPDYYLPMLRASVAIPGLNPDKLLKEMESKQVVYSQGIWEAVLSKCALEEDEQGVRHLFNKYTMTRFEKEGKIPVPVRESTPVVPFPSAPYNRLDMQFIDVYICSLLDSQDVSLVFDVLRTLANQTQEFGLSRKTLQGIVRLAEKEKSKDELKWFKDEILPKVAHPSRALRYLEKKIEKI